MTRVTHFTAVWLSVSALIIYQIIYIQVGFLQSKFFADWLALIGLSFMSASTAPVAWEAVKNGIRTSTDKFLFSYWSIWTLVLIQRIWIILLALSRGPDGEQSSWYYTSVSGTLAIGFTLAAVFGASAPLQGEIPLPRREVIIFTVAGVFSGIIAGIAIGVYYVAGWVN